MIEWIGEFFAILRNNLGANQLAFYVGGFLIPVTLHWISANYFISIDHARISPIAYMQPSTSRRSVPWYQDPNKVSNQLRQRWYYFASVHILLCTTSFLMLIGVALLETPRYPFYIDLMPASFFHGQQSMEFLTFIVFELLILFIFNSIMQSYARTNVHRSVDTERLSLLASVGTFFFPLFWHFLFRLNWVNI